MTLTGEKGGHGLGKRDGRHQRAIVLLEPKFSKNVGSVARAMSNFGYDDLRLVAPREYDEESACVTACWASSLVKSASIHRTLEEAIADRTDVVGFSASYGKNRSSFCTVMEFARQQAESPAAARSALVFGPEDTGLRKEHIPHLRTLVRIPSSAENPSFNLAQAVLIALYEIERGGASVEDSADTPVWEDYLCLDEKLQAILHTSGFKSKHTSDDAVRVIRGIFKRLQVSKREMSMLLGLFSKIEISLGD